jgi:CheY-like chemotaxis protein
LLLAEDNLPDALMVREALNQAKLPFELHVVSDGERVIDFLEKAAADSSAPSPDLLLLDLNLPKIDGLEVLRRVRARGRFREIPALIITSSDAPTDRAAAAAFGAAYFRKPPSYSQFLEVGGVVKKLLQDSGLL